MRCRWKSSGGCRRVLDGTVIRAGKEHVFQRRFLHLDVGHVFLRGQQVLQQAHLVSMGHVDHHRAGGGVFAHREGGQLVGQGPQPADHGRSVGAGLELDLHVQWQVEAGTQFGERTQRLDATIGHHGHPIHPILQFGQDVRGEHDGQPLVAQLGQQLRSEERRVGKECRSRWSPYH